MGDPVELLVARHLRACRGFTEVVLTVPGTGWVVSTPCAEWDAAALVEHVIGFHEFLLLRPLGVRAHRPRTGPAARWLASERGIQEALSHPALDAPGDYFDGQTRRPRDVLGTITDDVLIHTWDLARAVGASEGLDDELCSRAYDAARANTPGDGSDLFAPAVPIRSSASTQDRLLALRGRDPTWRPEPGGRSDGRPG